MIYLIEDKTSRRNDYGWTNERIEEYAGVLEVIDKVSMLAEYVSSILEESDSVVLFHESFANAQDYSEQQLVEDFINSLEKKQVPIAYFSGSKSQRTLDDNVCNLNPSVLYANLSIFLNHILDDDCIDFRYLMFGSRPEIESDLLDRIDQVNNDNLHFDKVKTDRDIFVYLASENTLDAPFENYKSKEIFDAKCSDENLIRSIMESLNDRLYDSIFLPLCFGETLSDYLGLRFAMLIRLCDTINKFTPIFIYGVSSNYEIIDNECYDILKMEGVKMVSYRNQDIIDASLSGCRISEYAYQQGLRAIHLEVPSDIGDNHSVANKWAIYRWSYALGDVDDDIKRVRHRVDNSLYFKYMSALYPSKEISQVKKENLKISREEGQQPMNILYVDDEADDGWYELLCEIIYTGNDLEFNYLGSVLKSRSNDEIIELVMDKVEEKQPNVVILDFRLHPSDFAASNLKEVTGYKLLCKIKEYNRGIQVLMFSATNKVWNLQMFEHAEADGFVVKESPLNSIDSDFTRNSIYNLIQQLNGCAKHVYRKEIWQRLTWHKEYLCSLRKGLKLNREYAEAVILLLNMVEDVLFARNMKYPYASAFMNLFRIIEATANEWISDEANECITENGRRYMFKFRSDDSDLLNFIPEQYNPYPSQKLYSKSSRLTNYQKICNVLYKVGAYSQEAYEVANKRNDFTHPNLIDNSELASFDIGDFQKMFRIVDTLITNLKNI